MLYAKYMILSYHVRYLIVTLKSPQGKPMPQRSAHLLQLLWVSKLSPASSLSCLKKKKVVRSM